MKRSACVFLAILFSCMLCLAVGCQKDALPRPAFPLEEEVVAAALEKTGLPGEISESETTSYGEGHMLYVVRSPSEAHSYTVSPEEALANPQTRLIVASVSSAMIEGERMLSLMFTQKDVSERFAWEDWKRQIEFAALLYGGFAGDAAAYEALRDEEIPEGEGPFEWEAKLPGGYCWAQYSAEAHKVFNEYNVPTDDKRLTGTMIVKIYESQAMYQKQRDAYAQGSSVG